MKRKILIIILTTIALGICACGINTDDTESNDIVAEDETKLPGNTEALDDKEVSGDKEALCDTEVSEVEEAKPIINQEGITLEERIAVPEGYKRTEEDAGSLAAFMRGYKLKPTGSQVLLYDGTQKGNQSAHAAVFELPIEEYDLQQCADSVMRVYAEYYWSTGQYDKIAFHFTNGFDARYSKWREGYRIKVDGNNVYWSKTAGYDDSYESFVQYLKMVFMYAGTLSMESEAEQIQLSDIRVGDVFLYGASPGHVVMIVDVCEDESGKKAFLLGQGYMPAQEFHVLKNNMHDDDPWYYEDEIEYPLSTPEYTFKEGSLKRLTY